MVWVNGETRGSVTREYVEGLFDYPHYTRPETISDMGVPSELLSGDPLKVSEFRRRASLIKTYERRPELLSESCLGDRDTQLLKEYFDTFVD